LLGEIPKLGKLRFNRQDLPFFFLSGFSAIYKLFDHSFYSLIIFKKGNALHRQFNKISFCLSPLAKEKIGFCFFKTSKLFKFANRQTSQQKFSIDFKKPFDLLAKLPAKARGEAPSEASNSIWWCLLDDARTFFEQNPEDFAD